MATRQFKPKQYGAKRTYKRTSIRSYTRRKAAPQVPKTKLEVKSLDRALLMLVQSPSTATNIQAVNIIENGSAFYNRIGTEIKMKSLHITGYIQRESANAAVSDGDYIRLVVIYDKQTNGAYPTFANIFTDYDLIGSTTTNWLSGINLPMKKRFKILMDERIYMPPCGINGVSGPNTNLQIDTQCLNINRYIKLKGLASDYSTSTGSIGDITTGGLYFLTVGNTAANADAYAFNGKARLRFWDP